MQEDIYTDGKDRQQFLSLLHNTIDRYNWYCHAYCLMDNHYHLLIETSAPTLSKGIKFLNDTYTQYFNRQHRRVGHVFQGRFKAMRKKGIEIVKYWGLNPLLVTKINILQTCA